jgi:hypothetical protein
MFYDSSPGSTSAMRFVACAGSSADSAAIRVSDLPFRALRSSI